jgi:hypothetical protein
MDLFDLLIITDIQLVKESVKVLHTARSSISRWWDRKVIHSDRDPLISFFNQHYGDIVFDRVFTSAIRFLANKPGFLMVCEQSFVISHTRRTAKYF